MKISFRARFQQSDSWKDFYDQEKLHDSFLVFLPKRLEISPMEDKSYHARRRYEIKMETDQVYSLAEIKEKLEKLKVKVSDVSNIKTEFTKDELKNIKKMVCFKEIFEPSEGKTK